MVALLLLIGLTFFSFSALIALSVGILEAPWPILLGILIVGLLGIQWMSMQGRAIATSSSLKSTIEPHSPGSSESSTTDHDDSLSDQPLKYRGIAYGDVSSDGEADSEEELSDSLSANSLLHIAEDLDDTQPATLHGTYRGQQWEHQESVVPLEEDMSSKIVYRGRKVNQSPDTESES
ncbi:MAG: hypothetical protein AAFR31_06610 [Cyanobacteria bacterium J06627_8]